MSQRLDVIYANRFASAEKQRERVWLILTQHYFQKWIRETDTVVDVGAGYCEFINNIRAKQKFAIDLNPAVRSKAAPGVIVRNQDISQVWDIPSDCADIIFTSNFFEHLPTKNNLQRCLEEAYRVLRPGGKLLAMGPNIRFCGDVYWDFFDHYLPLSDRSLVEAMEMVGLKLHQAIPRFLPFTMQGKSPTPGSLIRLYLHLPIFWKILGKQFLVISYKPMEAAILPRTQRQAKYDATPIPSKDA